MSDETPKRPKRELKLHVPEDLVAVYCNMAMINHTPEEFVLDFAWVEPVGGGRSKVQARVVLSPAHAKRLAGALVANIQRYEAQFGTIAESKLPIPKPPRGPVN